MEEGKQRLKSRRNPRQWIGDGPSNRLQALLEGRICGVEAGAHALLVTRTYRLMILLAASLPRAINIE